MLNVLIGVAVLILLVYRQLQVRAVKEESSARLVLILGVIGVVQTVDAAKKAHLHSMPAAAVAVLAVVLVAGGLLGAWRASTVRLWRDEAGVAWRQGTAYTAALWIVSLLVHLAGDALLDHVSGVHSLGTATILIYLAVTLGVQRELIRVRVGRGELGSSR